MKNPKIKTIIVHSQSKPAWNVVGENLGQKYKIARIPYVTAAQYPILEEHNRLEAFNHAEFISYCFNNSDAICALKI